MELKELDDKKIKIANKIYKIKLKKKIKNGHYLGHTHHHKLKISICTNQSKEDIIDTFLHEVLHCIWYTQGIINVTDSSNLEEFIVNSTSVNLMSIFQDNPWILDLLKEA